MINWKVRLKNKTFWLAIIPALLLVVQSVASMFGYEWDFGLLNEQIRSVVEAAFTVLAILGIVADPTTKGLGDSIRALNYEKPSEGEEFDWESEQESQIGE